MSETIKKGQVISGNKKVLILKKGKNLTSSVRIDHAIDSGNTERNLISDALLLSEKRFRTLYYQSPIAIEHYNKKGTLIDVNPSCLSMFGVNNLADLRNFNLFNDPNLSEEHKKMLRRNETIQYQGLFDFDKVSELKLYPTKKSGSIWIDVIITPLKNSQEIIDGYLVQIIDITERKTAEESIHESEEKYRALFENVQDVFYKIDLNGKIIEISPSVKYLSGINRNELIGHPVVNLYANPKDRKTFLNELMKNGELRDYEVKLKSRTGNIIYSSINARLNYDAEGKPNSIMGALRDITKRKIAEEALKESEEKYRLLFENASQAIAIAQGNFFQLINPKTCELLGYSEEEILSIPIPELIYAEDREMVIGNYRKRLNDKPAPQNYHFRFLSKDKMIIWVELNAVLIKWMGKNATLNFLSDITKRKIAQEELQHSNEQLHQLTKYIEEVREVERLAISRELHDDLGQALTAVKIDLVMIKQKISNNEILQKIERASALVSDTIKSVQRITSNLRPDIIFDLGLDAAIELYAKEFSERSGIKVLLNMDTGLFFSSGTALNIYRIVQESLTNISRHARATKVDIRLKKISESVSVIISDNGKGINENDIKSKHSFGIMSMKERAKSFGGTFDIYNKNKKGTEIKLILPLPKI